MLQSVLRLPASAPLTPDQFYDLCCANPDWNLEQTAAGDLVLMAPTGGNTGRQNADLVTDLTLWNRQTKLGYVFDSSTGFTLANGATRAPDLAWVRRDRWETLSMSQQEKFPPLAPDFLVELMSPTDRLTDLQPKMVEYQDNGVQLGWLINPKAGQVEIYRIGQEKEVLQVPPTLSGETVLPGFILQIDSLWQRSPWEAAEVGE
ncbi:MAG: Uma2 family endonuclease [Synechococcales bacterium]|nr:Uma2 family endonuclease [Synechococcales bacterium]